MIEKAVSLWNNTGNHDKVYYIQIVSVEDNKFIVTFQYGRRGKSLRFGTKTDPASHWEANRIFEDKLEQELKKGYRVTKNDDEVLTLVGLSY